MIKNYSLEQEVAIRVFEATLVHKLHEFTSDGSKPVHMEIVEAAIEEASRLLTLLKNRTKIVMVEDSEVHLIFEFQLEGFDSKVRSMLRGLRTLQLGKRRDGFINVIKLCARESNGNRYIRFTNTDSGAAYFIGNTTNVHSLLITEEVRPLFDEVFKLLSNAGRNFELSFINYPLKDFSLENFLQFVKRKLLFRR